MFILDMDTDKPIVGNLDGCDNRPSDSDRSICTPVLPGVTDETPIKKIDPDASLIVNAIPIGSQYTFAMRLLLIENHFDNDDMERFIRNHCLITSNKQRMLVKILETNMPELHRSIPYFTKIQTLYKLDPIMFALWIILKNLVDHDVVRLYNNLQRSTLSGVQITLYLLQDAGTGFDALYELEGFPTKDLKFVFCASHLQVRSDDMEILLPRGAKSFTYSFTCAGRTYYYDHIQMNWDGARIYEYEHPIIFCRFLYHTFPWKHTMSARELYIYQYSLHDNKAYRPVTLPPGISEDEKYFYATYEFRVFGQKQYVDLHTLYTVERIKNARINWYRDLNMDNKTLYHSCWATLWGCSVVYFSSFSAWYSILACCIWSVLYVYNLIIILMQRSRKKFYIAFGSTTAVILVFALVITLKRRLKREKVEQALTVKQAQGVAMILQFLFRESKYILKASGYQIPKNHMQVMEHIDKRISNYLRLFQGLHYAGILDSHQNIDPSCLLHMQETDDVIIEQGWKDDIGERLLDIQQFIKDNAMWISIGSLSCASLLALVYYALTPKELKTEEGLYVDFEKEEEMPKQMKKGGISRHQPDRKLAIATRAARANPVQSRNVNLFDEAEPTQGLYAGRFYAQAVNRDILDRVAAKELNVDDLWQYQRIYIVTENNTLIPISMNAQWSNKSYVYDVFKTIATHANMTGNSYTFKVFPGTGSKISDPVRVTIQKSDMIQPIPRHEQGLFGDGKIVNGLHKIHELSKAEIIHQAVTNFNITEVDKARIEHADNAYSALFNVIAKYDLAAKKEERYDQALLRGRRFSPPDILRSHMYYSYVGIKGPREGNAFIAGTWWWTANHVALDLKPGTVILTNYGQKIVQNIINSAKDDVCKFQIRDFDPSKTTSQMYQPPSLTIDNRDYNGLGFILSWKRDGVNYIPQLSMGYCVKTQEHCYHYIPTQGGDSGSAVLSDQGDVLFIHQGALANHNYGHPCTIVAPVIKIQDKLQQRYIQEPSVDEPVQSNEIINYHGMRHLKNGNLKIVGSITMLGGSSRQRDPKFVKSAFYDQHAAECDLPAEPFQKFGPTVPSSEVLWKDIAKYDCNPSKDWNPDPEILRMTIDVQRLKFTRIYPRQARVRSFIFALRFIDFTKASGWPFCNLFATKYQAIEWMCKRFPKFWNEVLLKDNPQDYLLWVQHHKEELRAVEKLLEEKHRSVNGGPFEHLVASKMIFGDLHDMWYACEFSRKNSTVGWSPFKGGVNRLVRFMDKFDKHYVSDLKKQDSRTANELREIAYELDVERIDFENVYVDSLIPDHLSLWSDCIAQCDAQLEIDRPYDMIKRSKSLITQGMKPLMKVEDNIVQREHGLSSGEDRTLNENTKNNDFSWTYCAIKYYRDKILCTSNITLTPKQVLGYLDENYRHIHCGDDSWWSTHDQGMDQNYYHDNIRDLAFDSEVEQTTTLGEVAYCGMRFIQINDIWFFTPDEAWKVIASLALEKRSFKEDRMQHYSKLDALALLSAMDVQLSMKIIKLRNILLQELYFDSTVQRVNPRSHLECVKLHFPEYEVMLPQFLEDFYQVITGSIKRITFYEQGLIVNTITVKYHGNYCGPNWSAGKVQPSVAESDVPPIDDFDYTCQQHDFSYGRGDDLDQADQDFFERNFGKGFKRSFAASAVWLQRMVRRKGAKNKRGQKGRKNVYLPKRKIKNIAQKVERQIQSDSVRLPQRPASRMGRRQMGIQRQVNPISIGYSGKRATRFRTVRKTAKIEIVAGTDYYGPVNYNNTLGNKAGDNLVQFLVAPSVFVGSRLGVYNLLFQYFKFLKFGVEFIPNKGMSTDGQLAMFYVPDPDDATLIGTDNVRVADASRRATFFSIFEHQIAWLPINGTVKKYYTNAASTDARFTQQAMFYLIAHSDLAAGLNTLGTLRIHFVVKFEEPYVGTFTQTDYSSWKNGSAPTVSTPFGTSAVQDSNSTMAISYNTGGGLASTFVITNQQVGQYFFFGYAITGNLSAPTLSFNGCTTFFGQQTPLGTSNTGFYIMQVTAQAPSCALSFASSSVTSARAFFAQMASAAPTAPVPANNDLQKQIDDLKVILARMLITKGKERVEEVDEDDDKKSVGSQDSNSKEQLYTAQQRKELAALRLKLGLSTS